jgi:hypothetical protein
MPVCAAQDMTDRPGSRRQMSGRESDGIDDLDVGSTWAGAATDGVRQHVLSSSQLLRSTTVSPWNNSTPATTPMEPHRPRQQHGMDQRSQMPRRPAPPVAPRKISIGPIRPAKVPWMVRDRDSFKPATPIIPTSPSASQQATPKHALKVCLRSLLEQANP